MVVKRCVLLKHSHRYSKKRRIDYPEEEDRITGLPDEILGQILSRLTLKEATATSILSQRWKYQWTLITSFNLSFDCGKPLCDKAFKGQKFPRNIRKYRGKFVGWVDNVLKGLHLQQPTSEVDSFRVCFSLGASYSSNLDKWVKFAFEKRVRKFEMNLADFSGSHQPLKYIFPNVAELYQMMPCINFTSITSIRLMDIDVSSEVIQHLLNECELLEHLCVVRSNTIHLLDVRSLKLKKLEFYQCKPMDKFEIIAPNLVSLSYTGPETEEVPFKKENVPLLSEMVLGDDYCDNFIFEAPNHSFYFSQLEKLTLIIPPNSVIEEDYFPNSFPKMMNVKQLELRIQISRTSPLDRFARFIEAAPRLTKFVMKLAYIDDDIISDYDSIKYLLRINSDHENLQEIEIVGFNGHEYDYNFVLRLFEFCVCLKRITIDTRHPGYMWGPNVFCEAFATPDPEVHESALKRARKLRSQLPQGAELLIL